MAGPTEDPFLLRAAAGQAALRPAPYGSTDVWSYNGSLPGPEIRVLQGDRIRVLAENGLNEGTTVHWCRVAFNCEIGNSTKSTVALCP